MNRIAVSASLALLLMCFQNCGGGFESSHGSSSALGDVQNTPDPSPAPSPVPLPAPGTTPVGSPNPMPVPAPLVLQNLWTPLVQNGAVPGPRWGHAHAPMGDRFFVWGGWTGDAADLQYNGGAIYNPTTQTWTAISTAGAPIGRNVTRAVYTGSKIIVWGGVERVAGDVNTGAIYDPATDTWEPFVQKNTISPRHLHAMFWVAGKLLVIGGEGPTGALDDGHIYDPATQMWSPINMTNGPGADRTPAGVFTGDKVMMYGGCRGSTNAVYIYDLAQNSWQRRTPPTLPAARCSHTTVWTGQEMLVFGGTLPSQNNPMNTLLAYNPTLNSWREIPSPAGLTPRFFHSADWVNGRMYVFGGYTEFGNRPLGVNTGDVFY